MKLKLKVKKHANIPIIVISGDAMGQDVSKVTEKIADLMKENCMTIAIDCSELESIDSHGLGMFVYGWKMMDSKKGKLVFMNPSAFITTIFEGSNLDKVFTIVKSIEEL